MTDTEKENDIVKIEHAQGGPIVERAYSAATAFSPEERARLEKKLKWKLDARFSILIVIYILNCEYHSPFFRFALSPCNHRLTSEHHLQTLTVRMHRKPDSKALRKISV